MLAFIQILKTGSSASRRTERGRDDFLRFEAAERTRLSRMKAMPAASSRLGGNERGETSQATRFGDFLDENQNEQLGMEQTNDSLVAIRL